MLILILSDIQYLQEVAFCFEEGSNGQILIPPAPPNPITIFGKSCFRKGDTLCLCKTSINFYSGF